MSKRLSELYGTDVYSVGGEYVGRVEEVILNLEKGSVMSLCFKHFKESSNDEIKRILKEDSVSFDTVSTVGDIVLVKNKPTRRPKEGGAR
jgi:sporulation protein YlmC with PRC-barrel domain